MTGWSRTPWRRSCEADATGADIVCSRCIIERAGASISPKKTESALYEEDEALFAHMCTGEIGTVTWGKLYRPALFDSIRFPMGRVFEDIATVWRVIDRASRVAVIPDALFHYRMRQSSIARGHSMGNLIDYWTAYIERYEAFADRSDEYRRALTEQCVGAIGRTWCWCVESPREVRDAYAGELDKMSSFAREHTAEVMLGRYPLRTKALCAVGRWRSLLAWRVIYAANSLRHCLRRQRMYT